MGLLTKHFKRQSLVQEKLALQYTGKVPSINDRVKQAVAKAKGDPPKKPKPAPIEYTFNPDVYLQSPLWRYKQGLIFKRDNQVCQACLLREAFTVYHKHIQFKDFTGDERCYDLVSVCRDCEETFTHEN